MKSVLSCVTFLISLIFFSLSSINSIYAEGGAVDKASQFSVSLAALWLRPTASNLDYAVYTEPLPVTTPTWSQRLVKTSYHPAFDLGVGYVLADQTDQFNLDWLYLNSNDSASGSATGSASIAPSYFFGPTTQALRGTSASSNARFTISDIRLVFQHLFIINSHLQLMPFAGLGTAYLKQYIVSTYAGAGLGGDPYSITSFNTSKFIGAGPRIGFNASGFFNEHFGIVTEMAVSLLAGSMDSITNFSSFGAGNQTPQSTSLANQSDMRVVPELESHIGLVYNYLFNSGSRVNFQLGYRLNVYLNGINQVVPTALVPGAFNGGVIAIETSAQVQTNMELNGPYLQLNCFFDV